jgi:hypothetical protein
MGSNAQISLYNDPQTNIAVQKEQEQSILQADILQSDDGLVANRNAEEITHVGISSSVVEAPSSITYIHFREIPKDSLKTNHIAIILGPERATRPGEIAAYAAEIQKRKTALRIWGNNEVSIMLKAEQVLVSFS